MIVKTKNNHKNNHNCKPTGATSSIELAERYTDCLRLYITCLRAPHPHPPPPTHPTPPTRNPPTLVSNFVWYHLFATTLVAVSIYLKEQYSVRHIVRSISMVNQQFTNKCRQISNICRTLVENKIADHSDIVGASPVGAAPTTSSFYT